MLHESGTEGTIKKSFIRGNLVGRRFPLSIKVGYYDALLIFRELDPDLGLLHFAVVELHSSEPFRLELVQVFFKILSESYS